MAIKRLNQAALAAMPEQRESHQQRRPDSRLTRLQPEAGDQAPELNDAAITAVKVSCLILRRR